ncbi:cytidine deaminase [Martensiomyces pterosporus]|nr:cytidine deaminase [Martensiomyces pterosporus]
METTWETAQDEKTAQLVELALKARDNSYSPYSKFRVGAAVRTTSGEVFVGCNIENSAFSPTICAERVAVSSAVAKGFKQFEAIAISSDIKENPITPCGVCRQFMREFSKDLELLLVRPDGAFCRTTLEILLPGSFGPDSLNEPRE